MLENDVSVNVKPNNRSSRPEVFCENGALRNFTKFTGRHLWPEAYNFIKRDFGAGVFL